MTFFRILSYELSLFSCNKVVYNGVGCNALLLKMHVYLSSVKTLFCFIHSEHGEVCINYFVEEEAIDCHHDEIDILGIQTKTGYFKRIVCFHDAPFVKFVVNVVS